MSVTFREDFGVWWPDYDHKPEACFDRVKRHLTDSDVAVLASRKRRSCVQAGGHAGLWPARLARSYKQVYTFEPEKELFTCLMRNISRAGPGHIICSNSALGDENRDVMMIPHVSAGSWRVGDTGTVPVSQITIDSLLLQDCDAIFLDIEGYEVNALRGAQQTIWRCRPVLHVEELDRSKKEIQDFMHSIGYALLKTVHSDAVYLPWMRK